ncbi:MAG: YihA family ribosome biogenesis GTP-binding protein [Rhizobiales bacterium]|nr:YihA family ribosome biogenesis GTP-binding protein [Hyphomicrobiales bacterium]
MTGPANEDETPDLETGRWLFAQPCDFVRGVVALDGLPPMDLPEIAFAGRSNVGKSSLINALTGRKTLARTSNTPGRTKELNFFSLGAAGNPVVMLVDLPGYGYARESRDKVNAWTDLVMAYLRGRANLRRVLVLIDSRHGLKANDHEVMSMLDTTAVSYQIVLTKADKMAKGELEKCIDDVSAGIRKHVAAHPHIIATSSEKGTGIAELRAEIAALADVTQKGRQ